MSRRHPFRHLESDFQLFLQHLETGDYLPGLEKSQRRIDGELTYAAARILKSPRFRGCGCSPEETSIDFQLRVWDLVQRGYCFRQPFFPWAYVALSNLCRDAARRSFKHARRRAPLNGDVPGKTPSPLMTLLFSNADRGIRRRQLLVALRSLPFESRTILVGQYWRRRTVMQQAAKYGVAPITVNRRRKQAHRLLEQALGDDVLPDAA